MLQLGAQPREMGAWERFLELKNALKANGSYQYVRLRSLENHAYLLPNSFTASFEPKENTLVFVNGAFSATLSQVFKPIIAQPISLARKTYGTFLNSRLQKLVKDELDPFVQLNNAYFEEGLFLYIPPNTALEAPLKLVFLQDDFLSPTLILPRIHCFVGKNSHVHIQSIYENTSQTILSSTLLDFALEENAKMSFSAISSHGEMAHDFLAIRATLKQKSLLQCFQATNGSATSRHDYAIKLMGEGAEAALYGASSLTNLRQHHVHVRMEHLEPYCRSTQKFKAIVAGASRSSFEGKIFVDKVAQKTEAFQANNNLILSDTATAYSKPNLEIFADDVKASHGSTVGQLDEEQLFYLTTRGCSKESARRLLVKGFVQEITNLFSSSEMRQRAIEVMA